MIAAWIGAGAVVLAGGFPLVQWLAEPKPPAEAVAGAKVRISGRVANARTDVPIRKAQIRLEAQGVPSSTESDSEGTFVADLPAEYSTVRLRITARGFTPYDRLLPRDVADQMLLVNLEPEAAGRDSSSVRPRNDEQDSRPFGGPSVSEPRPAAKASLAGMLNGSLPQVGSNSDTWAVIVFGEQERRDDVDSSLRAVLADSGHETVRLFRKVSDEQRLAADIHRGASDVLQQLQSGRYCTRILAARLSVAHVGVTEGITIARAKLNVHVLSPSGESLNRFELSEKGGGEDDSSSKRHAVDELLESLPRELPGKIN
ncbi:MAG TPA: carboxypeptidase-like regulatory domain-containing protein [Thermoanaerobaculia bacterium]|jgi:hypothetical protein